MVCLLERVPFTVVDSLTSLRKLESEELEDAEKLASRELGRESGVGSSDGSGVEIDGGG